MYRNILVPVKLEESGELAFRKALELVDPDKATVTLLHVIETIQGGEFEELEDFYLGLSAKACELLDGWCAGAGSENLSVLRAIAYGRRGREIVRYAEEQDCDLIVVASHRLDRDHPKESFGTISHQVALLALCPVLMLR